MREESHKVVIVYVNRYSIVQIITLVLINFLSLSLSLSNPIKG